MAVHTLDALESTCRQVVATIGRPWSWDERFGMALLTLTRDDLGPLRTVTAALGHGVTSKTLADAPERIRDLAGDVGGVDPGQHLLHSNPEEPAIVFATVWLWANGKNLSLRMGYSVAGMNDEERRIADERFKSWFGLP